ncbi:MAG: dihydrofolate reductase [Patescibacteria group bacterium]
MEPKNSRISLIAALSSTTRAIGRGGRLLWDIPEDMARFKKLTSGHPVIMGRKTWESLPPRFRPLPGRTNIVVSRIEDYFLEGALLAHSLPAAIALAKIAPGGEEVFVIGGGEIYRDALPHADRLYLTLIEDDRDGDTYFPEYAHAFGKVLFRESHTVDRLKYSFVTFERGSA